MDWPTLLANRPLPLIMGILNVTPDSFSDGGEFFSPELAVERGLRIARDGAGILDIGGESTRPPRYGPAEEVPVSEEIRRVLPVIERLAGKIGIPISIDTRKAEVARAALKAGAAILNDVTALRHDPAMAAVVAEAGAGVILMHMRGTDPATMQSNLEYGDLVGEVRGFLADSRVRAAAAGISPDRIAIDPGLGFSKSAAQSLALLREIPALLDLGSPVVVGASRKNFVGAYSARPGASSAESRLPGSLACAGFAARRGAAVVRVHDVAETAAYLAMSRSLDTMPP
ncbi:MAG: dihydropteroate synthase [Thermoanaerobaculia bacterium]